MLPRSIAPDPGLTLETISASQVLKVAGEETFKTGKDVHGWDQSQARLFISSPPWGVCDVALRAFGLHCGRVILSGVYDESEAMSTR